MYEYVERQGNSGITVKLTRNQRAVLWIFVNFYNYNTIFPPGVLV